VPVSPEEAFGKAVRELREGKGLSQEALGFETRLHRTYIGMLERGERSASLRTLFALARGLSVRPHEIVKRTEELRARRTRL